MVKIINLKLSATQVKDLLSWAKDPTGVQFQAEFLTEHGSVVLLVDAADVLDEGVYRVEEHSG